MRETVVGGEMRHDGQFPAVSDLLRYDGCCCWWWWWCGVI